MPPFWKIPRELHRIWQQLSYVFVHPVELAIFAARRRLNPELHRRRTGDQAMGRDVAVFLLYQPRGIPASAVRTCVHLGQQGYSVVVVSNGRVSDTDWASLSPHVATLLERPNFGYDFGGYRHGILHLLDSGKEIDNLLILNDSIWFPVFSDSDLLSRMRAAPADVTGPVYYEHRTARRSHLQSYLMNFGPRAVAHPRFRAFWTRYSQTNNKIQTIRRGEMKVSHAMRKVGLTLSAIFDSDQVHAAIGTLDADDLRRVLTYEAARNPALADRIKTVLEIFADTPTWQDAALALVDDAAWRRYFLTNHPISAIVPLGFPILKKDRGYEYRQQRREVLALLADGRLPGMCPVIEAEVRARD